MNEENINKFLLELIFYNVNIMIIQTKNRNYIDWYNSYFFVIKIVSNINNILKHMLKFKL